MEWTYHSGMGMQVSRTGLYSQEDDLAGMAEVNSDDAQEPDWAPNAEADSPGSYGEPGEVVGSKKLQPSKKRIRGTLTTKCTATTEACFLEKYRGH